MGIFDSKARLSALLVDDDPIISTSLADGLRRAKFDVTVSTNGAEALELVRRSHFSIVVLDYKMPGMDGGDIADHLASLSQPFMFLSAYSDETLVDRVIAAGALAYVVKPVDPLHFAPTVRAAALRGRDLAALTERAQRLAARVDSDREVNVCVGLVMVQRGVTREAAYETLRQHARRSRRRLPELAAELMRGANLLFGLPLVDIPGSSSSSPTDVVADST